MRLLSLFLLLTTFQVVIAVESDDSLICRIQRRYYLIKRLEKPTQLFYKKMKEADTDDQEKVLNDIKRTMVPLSLKYTSWRGIESLNAVWEDFLSYKYIDDDLFDKEVVIVVLLLYKNMLVSLLERTDETLELSERIDAYIATLHQRADYVHDQSLDAIIGTSSSIKPIATHTQLLHELLLGHTAWSDFCPQAPNVHATLGTLVHVLDNATQKPTRFVVSNTMRLYHIQRMLKALFILSYHAKTPVHISWLSATIKTPIARDCARHIEKTHSLLPLFQFWQRIICYDFIDDVHEIKEFMHLVIVVYKHLAYAQTMRNAPEVLDLPVHDVLALYDEVASLDIAELLDLLDDVATQFDHIHTLYELNNPDLNWTEWFKKYWWVVPVVVTWVYLTILKHTDASTAHKIV